MILLISPPIFYLYNDMSQHPESQISLFADDSLLCSVGHNRNAVVRKLQKHIYLIEAWFHQCKISLNPTKIVATMFTYHPSRLTSKIVILNHKINQSNSFKYVGFHIDNKLNFVKQTNYVIQQVQLAKFKLYPLLNYNRTISIRTKIQIYETYINPILLYAAPRWTTHLSTQQLN